MSRTLTVAWRDFRAAFNQPATFYFLAGFLAVAGLLFVQQLLQFSDLSELAQARARDQPGVLHGLSLDSFVVRPLLGWMLLLLIVVVPLLTMRSFAEEQRSGTLELLLTSPVSPVQLVLGKFLGAWGLSLVAIALTGWFPVVLTIVADPDTGPLLAGYFGLVLGAAAFTAVGVLASALTDSPLLAAFLAFVGLVISGVCGMLGSSMSGPGAEVLSRLSILLHVAPLHQGVLDAGSIAWLVLGTAGLLFTTQRVLESRRWR